MTPWEQLGLDREQARDQTAVKRAYARLLKLHRPDKDPEGFRRIRDAYELLSSGSPLLTMWQDDDEDDERVIDEPTQPLPASADEQPPANPPAEPAPVQMISADPVQPLSIDLAPRDQPVDLLGQTIAALAKMVADADRDAVLCEQAARAVLVQAGDDGHARARAVTALAQHLATRPEVLAILFDDQDVLIALEADIDGPAEILLDHWRSSGNWRRLGHFAEAVAVRLGEGHTGHAVLAARLAGDLATREPRIAQRLVDLSYRELPPGQRSMLERVDYHLAMGCDMDSWSPAVRHRFIDALDEGKLPDDPIFRKQVSTLIGGLPATSPLRLMTAERLPTLRLRGAKPLKRATATSSSSTFGCGGRSALWIIAVMLINMLRLCSSHTTPSYSYDPPHPIIHPIQLPPTSMLPQRLPVDPVAESTARQLRIMQAMAAIHGAASQRVLVAAYVRGEVAPFLPGSDELRELLVAVIIDEGLDEQDRIAAVERLGEQKGTMASFRLGMLVVRPLPPTVKEAVQLAVQQFNRRSQTTK